MSAHIFLEFNNVVLSVVDNVPAIISSISRYRLSLNYLKVLIECTVCIRAFIGVLHVHAFVFALYIKI